MILITDIYEFSYRISDNLLYILLDSRSFHFKVRSMPNSAILIARDTAGSFSIRLQNALNSLASASVDILAPTTRI